MSSNNSVYLAWQSPNDRSWHVVGLLSKSSDGYVFNYTHGAKLEKFIPFSGMEDIQKTYWSKDLFPLFQNRILSSRRPEYPHFIKWLGLLEGDESPITILGRSGGMRGTDQLQTFKPIEFDEDGQFEHLFFAHGLRHLTASANERVSQLKPGEELFLCLDCQNEFDENAVMIRAGSPAEIVGYCPRYLAKDLSKFLSTNKQSIKITVETLSADAPANYRLMCKVKGKIEPQLVEEFRNNAEFQLLSGETVLKEAV